MSRVPLEKMIKIYEDFRRKESIRITRAAKEKTSDSCLEELDKNFASILDNAFLLCAFNGWDLKDFLNATSESDNGS
jgi:hypothetical protein